MNWSELAGLPAVTVEGLHEERQMPKKKHPREGKRRALEDREAYPQASPRLSLT